MNTSSPIHKKITITGHVQGVGYRFACKKMAQSFGLKGFVRNLANGQVYIEAEGYEEQLTWFISWCHQGPPHAQIQNIDTQTGSLTGFTTFDIRH